MAVHLGNSKLGSATTAVDYHGGDHSAVSFQLSVSDHHDVELVLTNNSVKWGHPEGQGWKRAGRIEVSTFLDPHRQRLSRSNHSEGERLPHARHCD